MYQLFSHEPMWRSHELKSRYDVVIIGAGVHGLATAYYLGKEFGITRVALLEKSYLGAGNSGRNTAILRANYRTPEGIPFYASSLSLYEELAWELGWNLMFTQCGHLTLGHSDSSITGLRVRAETNKLLGVDSRLIFPDEIGELVPALDLSPEAHMPVLAALYHPPGGIIRHDAVVWAYARACDRMGIEIHNYTEATDIEVSPDGGRVTGVQTNRGFISTPAVVNCTSGLCTTITKMVGIDLPIISQPLQACVTEPMKPFLDKVIVSASLHVYVNQTDRGELVIGAEIDPYQTYSMKSTLPTLEQMSQYTLELFPQLHQVKVLRQWGGVCDMTPDFAPVISGVDGLDGFFLDVGWGTYGFKAGPAGGRWLAELIATSTTPKLIRPFALSRFSENRLVGEKAAAAVSH
ncbi:MAG: FAD-dependent oxidoreductase [Planctomycetota bacterium]|nr:FAD-dependent oxidoreductase [Planctomycetota bacterium]MDA1141920.1 FAD-dependent oxidoreductase [Planctomycetota bacterium]